MLTWSQGDNRRGFTLLETLLSVALVALLAGAGTPIYQALQNRNNLDIAATTLVSSVRRAQVLSQASAGDSAWGAYIEQGTITVFKGASYAARDAGFDENASIAESITVVGDQEWVFSKFAGELAASRSVTLTSNEGETRTITTNEKGATTF